MKRRGISNASQPLYFYCARSAAEPERSEPAAVFASLLRQLSCLQPGAPIPAPVVAKFEQQGKGFKSKGPDLGDCLDLIIVLVKKYDITTIIVDALDECDFETRQSLLDAFEDILRESAGLVKIFLSSRDDFDIVCTLREYPNLDISSDKNSADIHTFVRQETKTLVRKRQILRHSTARNEMQALIIDQVSSGADGM